MNEPAKKRKRDGRDDNSPPAADAEEGGGIGAAHDSMMAEVRSMLEQNRSEILAEIQGRMDAVERRNDVLANKIKAQEERCRFLEVRCDSLQRSVQILVKSQDWGYSAPDVPDIYDSYWKERGYDEEYIEQMVGLIRRMMNDTLRMRSGENVDFICFRRGNQPNVLLHDEVLLPHWREFADALQLSNFSGRISMGNIQLPSSVLGIIAPALATKRVKCLRLGANNFARTSDGIQFAAALIRNNPYLETFAWIGNPIENTNQANDILEVVVSHPTLNAIRLENSFGPNVNGYSILCSLLNGNKNLKVIDFESSNIVTRGRTDLAEILATNPPLQRLCLGNNNLDDDDAVLIADALKRNTNLKFIVLDNNDITDVGWDALHNALFDSSGLNSMADCNHTCCIHGNRGVYNDIFRKNYDSNPNLTRGQKLYILLTKKYLEGSILNDLDLEFGDDAVTIAPNVLECVHLYSGCLQPSSQRLGQPLSIMYEILRGWKVPELFEGHNRQ